MKKNNGSLSPVTRQIVRDLRGRKDFDKHITQLIIDDLRKRDINGFETYGKPLGEPDDPRDWLEELEQEILDASQYARAEIMRRALKKKRAVNIVHMYQQLLTLLVTLKDEREIVRRGKRRR